MQVGVDEASARLGLTAHRVRHLIRAGDLPAHRLAGRWVVDTADVDRLAENRSPGRPLSPRMAWGLIRLLETGAAPELSAAERSRLRARLREAPPLDQLARICRVRSHVHRLHAHPGGLPRAVAFPGALRTGASASGHDVIDTQRIELYLPEADFADMRRVLRVGEAGEGSEANLIVRVPAVEPWPFADEVVGPVTIALDLWEAGDSRSRRAAARLYRKALAHARFEARRR